MISFSLLIKTKRASHPRVTLLAESDFFMDDVPIAYPKYHL